MTERGTLLIVALKRVGPSAMVLVGVLYAAAAELGYTPPGGDAYAYWRADPLHPYVASTVGNGYAFLYSPAFAQAIEPLRVLGWPIFLFVWTVLLSSALAWTARGWALALFVVPPVFASIALGNIEMLLAAAIVAGFRWPAVWSFVLLTKVTPGIGLAWFAVRREWRSLATALGATVAIGVVSFAIAPNAWFDWIASLRANAGQPFPLPLLPGPLGVRLAVALAVVTIGATRTWRWCVPLACAIAAPLAYWTVIGLGLAGIVGVLIRGSAAEAVGLRSADSDSGRHA